MGAINFITTDDSDTNKRLVLAPPESADRLAEQESGSVSVDPPDTPIQVIEDCCKHWRASEVRPHWAALNEPKMENSTCFWCLFKKISQTL
jgi:hypothetical protein